MVKKKTINIYRRDRRKMMVVHPEIPIVNQPILVEPEAQDSKTDTDDEIRRFLMSPTIPHSEIIVPEIEFSCERIRRGHYEFNLTVNSIHNDNFIKLHRTKDYSTDITRELKLASSKYYYSTV